MNETSPQYGLKLGLPYQSVKSRLETSRYQDFFHFFESIGIGLDKFGLEVSVSENFSLKKRLSISLEKF